MFNRWLRRRALPLSREVCEALRDALQEVRGHRFAVGDHVWPPSHARRTGVGVLADADAVAAINEDAFGAYWCPSLSDLLAMARARLGGHVLILEVGWKQEDPADDDIADCFCFTHVCGEGEHSIQHSADSPEEAVARWLLDHAEASVAPRRPPR